MPALQLDKFFSGVACDEQYDFSCSEIPSANECDIEIDIRRMLSNFFMQLEVLDCLSFETIQRIVEQIKELNTASIDAVKRACEYELRKHSLKDEIIASILEAFQRNPIEQVCGPRAILSTHKRRQSYYKTQIGHVEPVNVQLDALHSYSYCRNLKI